MFLLLNVNTILMNSTNINGSKIKPCGIPAEIDLMSEKLLLNKVKSSFSKGFTFMHALASITLIHTRSNTCAHLLCMHTLTVVYYAPKSKQDII